MGSWAAILAAYLLGGLTFIPLLVAAVVAHGYCTFPRHRRHAGAPRADAADADADAIVQPGDDTASLDAAREVAAEDLKTRGGRDLDVAAGYFAVCREYTPMGINAKPIERPTPVGPATVAPPSPSVYQTMYRSIFDRKPVAGPLEGNGLGQRPKKAGNVFYVVLRHGHLMLFDDDEQLEVRHVISLAHHDIGIYSGGDATPEGELFIKRNALRLSRRRDRPDRAPDGHVSKPFYLFSENCSAKEDFYFALLKNQEQTFGFAASPPRPRHFDVKSIISLVQRLHSSEDHLHSRWLNALLGRVFLAVYKTRDLEKFLRDKITNKISRVKRPSFLTNITIQAIDTGEAAPYFTNLKLRDLTVEGECVVEADVRYSGNFRIEVGATAKLDLGTRFKAREVNLVLAVVLRRVEGHVLFKIKPPPSNRVWFSFQTMPKMDMAIEPIVSSRQITYTVILRQIENRIKEVFAETLVQPFWDDVPFFRTEHKTWRGGIFEGDDAVEPSEGVEAPLDDAAAAAADSASVDRAENRDALGEPRPLEKSHSLPVMDPPERTGLFGRKLGRFANHSSTSVGDNANHGSASAAAAATGVDTKRPTSMDAKGPTDVGAQRPTSMDAKGSAGVNAAGLTGKGPTGMDARGPTGVDARGPAASALRSPSIVKNSTDPIVGTETAHADLFKPSSSPPDHATNLMAALQSRSQDASPMPLGSLGKTGSSMVAPLGSPGGTGPPMAAPLGAPGGTGPPMVAPLGSPARTGPPAKAPSQSSASSKEGGDGGNEETDANPVPAGRRNTASSADSGSHAGHSTSSSPTPSTASSFRNQAGSLGRSFFLRRETTNGTTWTESSNGDVKRNTLAAVTHAAAQARQWGWNAIQRQKDARRNGDKAAQVDLSQPMGRGQPLPPPGVPLPGPTNGRTKIGPMPAPRRKRVADQQLPEAPEAERAPPSPRRGRRGASRERGGEAEQGMLVVAAPDDSQPGTPAAEDEGKHEVLWAEEAAAVEGCPAEEAAAGSWTRTRESSVSDKLAPGSPVVALPAAAVAGADDDDDDDYSGWMEEVSFDDEQTGETLHAAAGGEGGGEAGEDL